MPTLLPDTFRTIKKLRNAFASGLDAGILESDGCKSFAKNPETTTKINIITKIKISEGKLVKTCPICPFEFTQFMRSSSLNSDCSRQEAHILQSRDARTTANL